MNWNLIIENLGLFTALTLNIFIVKRCASKSKGGILMDFSVIALIGGFSIIMKDIICLLYSLPLMLFKRIDIDLFNSFSGENLINTMQFLYSFLIFDILLYIYLRFCGFLKVRNENIIENGRKKQIKMS